MVNLVKINEIRDLTSEDLNNKIVETEKEIQTLRFSNATGNLEKPSRIRELRKQVARMKTILRERELENK